MYNVNGWISVSPLTVDLVVGSNTIDCWEHVQLVPPADGCHIAGFNPPPVEEAGTSWIMDVTNTSTQFSVTLDAESDMSPITLPPASNQRLCYNFGVGWIPLMPAVVATS